MTLPYEKWRPGMRDYVKNLLASDLPEREQARAVLYAAHFGMERLEGHRGCVVFEEPACGNWNCLNPEHQVLNAE